MVKGDILDPLSEDGAGSSRCGVGCPPIVYALTLTFSLPCRARQDGTNMKLEGPGGSVPWPWP